MKQQRYTVYLLECADGTLYAGITTDVRRRIAEHNGGPRGARYTRGRQPVRLAYAEECASRSEALSREAALKSMTRAQKLKLAQTQVSETMPRF